ncbi:MAG: hypothetical protein M3364_09720 [Actinomycetota bacterium]|nr:hypothetical protein [Actinomycetota bacterium]
MGNDPVTLGRKYRDELTGLEGVATGRHEYMYGCVRWTLEFEKDGEIKTEVFDEQRLLLVETSERPQALATSGGPRPEPPRRP